MEHRARRSGHKRDPTCCLLGNRPEPTNASRPLLLNERIARHRLRRTLEHQLKGGGNERRRRSACYRGDDRLHVKSNPLMPLVHANGNVPTNGLTDGRTEKSRSLCPGS